MPMFFFHLRNSDALHDSEGTELPDVAAAREHATTVARELMFHTNGITQDWSDWTMTVRDDGDVELFSFKLSDVGDADGKD